MFSREGGLSHEGFVRLSGDWNFGAELNDAGQERGVKERRREKRPSDGAKESGLGERSSLRHS